MIINYHSLKDTIYSSLDIYSINIMIHDLYVHQYLDFLDLTLDLFRKLREEFEFPLCTLAVAAWILPDLLSELRAMQPPPGHGHGVGPLPQPRRSSVLM